MKILGIDPGSHRTGYAIIKKNHSIQIIDYGTIETPKNIQVPYNLLFIKKNLTEILDKFEIKLASIEEIFFNKNMKTASRVFEARGVLILTLIERDISIVQPTVTQIKKGVTGSGKASKKEIHRTLKHIFQIESLEGNDDAWDAIATGFVGLSIFSSSVRK